MKPSWFGRRPVVTLPTLGAGRNINDVHWPMLSVASETNISCTVCERDLAYSDSQWVAVSEPRTTRHLIQEEDEPWLT